MELPILSDEEISITIGQAYTNSKLSLIDFSMLERDKAVAEAQCLADLEWFVKWGDSFCPHRDADFPSQPVPQELRLEKRDCRDCWQKLEGKLLEG